MSELKTAIEKIETDGYCLLRGVYDKQQMAEALNRVRWWDKFCQDRTSDKVPFLNVGQSTVYNLQNKDIFFLNLLFGPKIPQDIQVHFLNDRWFKQIPQNEPNYIVRSYIARSSNHELPMHIDSFVPYLGDHVFMMQYSIILEDQSAKNGCTVVVPGSHKAGAYTTQDARKDAIALESEVGDVVVWDSRLWHGTTANETDGTRWAIIATFCRWWCKQHWNIPQAMPQEIYDQLTPSQKAVLGFCSVPHLDEAHGIDLKCGYDDLPSDVRAYRPKGEALGVETLGRAELKLE